MLELLLLVFLSRIIDNDANTINTANNNIIMIFFVNTNEPKCMISEGIAGTMNLRVKNTATIDGAPKMIAVLKFNNFSLYLEYDPTKLVSPTINKEYAVD
jgi:hypothetical protein